jgi:hypothetical protein
LPKLSYRQPPGPFNPESNRRVIGDFAFEDGRQRQHLATAENSGEECFMNCRIVRQNTMECEAVADRPRLEAEELPTEVT